MKKLINEILLFENKKISYVFLYNVPKSIKIA